jgi:hypothetical protein
MRIEGTISSAAEANPEMTSLAGSNPLGTQTRAFGHLQDAFGLLLKGFAGDGQFNTTASALEQPDAKVGLQCLDLRAQRRL